MLRILCTGDSHTWGQGASGLLESYDPPIVGGELRLSGFSYSSYVNLLRDLVNSKTGSYASEIDAKSISESHGIRFDLPCAVIGKDPVTLEFEGSLLRIECALSSEKSTLEITADSQKSELFDLKSDNAENGYRLITKILNDGSHKISLRAESGEVRIYKAEFYKGKCAVVNCGIGSCPTFRYNSEFFRDYVEVLKPDIVLLEAHTINDWLSGETPDEYYTHLTELINSMHNIGSKVILMTVSPIAGDQILPDLAAEYDKFISESRRAAEDCGILVCDANAIMNICINGMTNEEALPYLFHDNWHVNDRGQKIYAQLLYQTLINSGYIE